MKKTIWTNDRRKQYLSSVDIAIIIKNKGVIYSITNIIRWDFNTKIFENWMDKTLQMKKEGKEKGLKAME